MSKIGKHSIGYWRFKEWIILKQQSTESIIEFNTKYVPSTRTKYCEISFILGPTIIIRGCNVTPNWAYFSLRLVIFSCRSEWDRKWVIKPSLASIFEGLQVDFPCFLFVVTGKRNGRMRNVAKEDVSSLSITYGK